MEKQIALIFFDIKEPKKETLKLQINDFAVSYHNNLDDAHFFAYYNHVVYNKVIDSQPLDPMFASIWVGFKFCFFTEYNKDTPLSMQKIEKQIRRKVFALYQVAKANKDIEHFGFELTNKIPEYILPSGYEIATDGIVDNTYQVMYKGDFLHPQSSTFYSHWIDGYIGKNVKDVTKWSDFRTTDAKYRIKDVAVRGTTLIRPIKK